MVLLFQYPFYYHFPGVFPLFLLRNWFTRNWFRNCYSSIICIIWFLVNHLVNYTLASQNQNLLYYILGYYLFRYCSQWMVHNVLNIISLFLSTVCLPSVSSPSPLIVSPLFKIIYQSLYSHTLDNRVIVLHLNWLLVLYVPRE